MDFTLLPLEDFLMKDGVNALPGYFGLVTEFEGSTQQVPGELHELIDAMVVDEVPLSV